MRGHIWKVQYKTGSSSGLPQEYRLVVTDGEDATEVVRLCDKKIKRDGPQYRAQVGNIEYVGPVNLHWRDFEEAR